MSNHNHELTATQLDEVAGGDKTTFSEFKVTKPTDVASPTLYGTCCKGTHIPEVTVQL